MMRLSPRTASGTLHPLQRIVRHVPAGEGVLNMATVTFDEATRQYPGNPIPSVDKLNIDIADGEFLVLVGPSGCGKSTSLRMLAGLEEVNGGRILIGDRDVTHLSPKDRDVAMVFQNYALYPHMTVADNMGFALKIAGASRWAGRSSVARRCSSWTSRCRTSTPSSACRRAPRSPRCSAVSVSRPSTSPTTRSRP